MAPISLAAKAGPVAHSLQSQRLRVSNADRLHAVSRAIAVPSYKLQLIERRPLLQVCRSSKGDAKKGIEDAADAVASAGKDAVDAAASIEGDAEEGVKDAANAAASFEGSAEEGVKDAAESFEGGAREGVKDAADAVKDKASN